MFELLSKCFFEMFFMILLGVIARKKNIITIDSNNSLSKLLINVLLPCSIIASASSNMTKDSNLMITQCIIIGFVYYIGGLFLSYAFFKAIPIDTSKRGVATTSTIFGNTAFIGYPLIQQLAGTYGLQLALSFDIFFNPLMYTVGINLFSGEKRNVRSILRQILSPCLVAILVANALTFTNTYIPVALNDALSIVGKSTTPLSMIIIGAGFVDCNFTGIFKDKYAYLVCLIKLIISPLILFMLLSLLNISKQVVLVCVIMASLPIGSFNVILPKQYGGDVEFANRALMISMILSLVTIPCIVMIIN